MARHRITDQGATRSSLQDARDSLDIAMGMVPNLEGGKVMATQPLLVLLVRVIMAKRRLRSLELEAAAEGRTFPPPEEVS